MVVDLENLKYILIYIYKSNNLYKVKGFLVLMVQSVGNSNEKYIIKMAKNLVNTLLSQFDKIDYIKSTVLYKKIENYLEQNRKITEISEIQRNFYNYFNTKREYFRLKDNLDKSYSNLIEKLKS